MALEDQGGFDTGGRLYKHDVAASAREVHDLGPGPRASEPPFVPGFADGGEGRLVGLVVDAAAETTDTAIIDARRFKAPPVATVRLPHRVPPGFHGNWLAAGADR